MLSLKNYLAKIPNVTFIKKESKGSKTFGAFAIATLVSGVSYYFQNEILADKNQKQAQLIQRVAKDTVKENFTKTFSRYQVDDWNCVKVTLDGSLLQGRFIIKRKRGSEQGYLVLAPFLIEKDDQPRPGEKSINRKIVLNMGWIPQSSKHMIPKTVGSDALGENPYAQDLIAAKKISKQKGDNLTRDPNNEQTYLPITTVTAYVRLGEKQNKLRKYANWKQSGLFKFIDLSYISRAFETPNFDEASTIYLDRTSESQDQNLPMPLTKEQLIADLKQQIKWNNIQTNAYNLKVFGAAYLTALLVSLI